MSRPRYGGTSTLELSLSLTHSLSLLSHHCLPFCTLFPALHPAMHRCSIKIANSDKRSALLESELGVYVEKAKRLSVRCRPAGIDRCPCTVLHTSRSHHP
jgi:hypothetical protein